MLPIFVKFESNKFPQFYSNFTTSIKYATYKCAMDFKAI